MGRSTGLASSSAHPSRFRSGMWGLSASRLLGQLEITRFPFKSKRHLIKKYSVVLLHPHYKESLVDLQLFFTCEYFAKNHFALCISDD